MMATVAFNELRLDQERMFLIKTLKRQETDKKIIELVIALLSRIQFYKVDEFNRYTADLM